MNIREFAAAAAVAALLVMFLAMASFLWARLSPDALSYAMGGCILVGVIAMGVAIIIEKPNA
jgi:hypothetical protein